MGSLSYESRDRSGRWFVTAGCGVCTRRELHNALKWLFYIITDTMALFTRFNHKHRFRWLPRTMILLLILLLLFSVGSSVLFSRGWWGGESLFWKCEIIGPSSSNWPALLLIVGVEESTSDGKAYNPWLCSPMYNVGLKWKKPTNVT